MKNILFLILFAFTAIAVQAQSKSKITETSVKVPGVCKMCKERIEEAAMRTKGVKMAEWDQSTQQLNLIFKNTKTTKEEICQSVAAIGHGFNLTGSDSAAYENLPDCCKYNDGVKSH